MVDMRSTALRDGICVDTTFPFTAWSAARPALRADALQIYKRVNVARSKEEYQLWQVRPCGVPIRLTPIDLAPGLLCSTAPHLVHPRCICICLPRTRLETFRPKALLAAGV
jgi:hypothetical protein